MATKAERRKALEAQMAELDNEPDDESNGNGRSRVENVSITIDLGNEDQVKRAVRAGYLDAKYLDDEQPEGEDDGEEEGEEPPKRTRARY